MDNETIERISMVIVESPRGFLFVRRVAEAGGMWTLPIGKHENGESDKEAAIRGLDKSTGILMDPGSLRYVDRFRTIGFEISLFHKQVDAEIQSYDIHVSDGYGAAAFMNASQLKMQHEGKSLHLRTDSAEHPRPERLADYLPAVQHVITHYLLSEKADSRRKTKQMADA